MTGPKLTTRRTFLRSSLATGFLGLAGAGTASLGACTTIPKYRPIETVDQILLQGARVMWCAPHPDDETLVGPILAQCGVGYGNPLYFLVLTHGDGGECCIEGGCNPDLATVRAGEMKKVAEAFHAELQHENYFNASLPVESFPKRHEIAQIWMKKKDPSFVVAEAIRRFKPDLVFTFEPTHGFTGHPEHQLFSRFVTMGIRRAADEQDEALKGQATHNVHATYYGLNRFWPLVMFGAADPEPVTEIYDMERICRDNQTCRDVMVEATKLHQSQDRDMSTLRTFSGWMSHVYLRRTDPFTEIYDPFEVVEG